MKNNYALTQAIQKHAIECYPNESCGLVVNGEYLPCENLSANPTQSFELDQALYQRAVLDSTLQAIIHSHCYSPQEKFKHDPRWATKKDMESWIATNVTWGIVATNGNEATSVLWYDDNDIPPLLERHFVYGSLDCYGIVRDYYRTVMNIKLMRMPSNFGWWDNGEDLYAENFMKAGFYEISGEEADVGDVCLIKVRSPVVNHAMVITGNNEILHHTYWKLSEHDRLDRWRDSVCLYLRHKDAALNSNKGTSDGTKKNIPTRRTN